MLASPTNRFLSLRRHSIITLFGTILLFSFPRPLPRDVATQASLPLARPSKIASFAQFLFRSPTCHLSFLIAIFSRLLRSNSRFSRVRAKFEEIGLLWWKNKKERSRRNKDENDIVKSISTSHTALSNFYTNKNVAIAWIPSHQGIADLNAKEALILDHQASQTLIPYQRLIYYVQKPTYYGQRQIEQWFRT